MTKPNVDLRKKITMQSRKLPRSRFPIKLYWPAARILREPYLFMEIREPRINHNKDGIEAGSKLVPIVAICMRIAFSGMKEEASLHISKVFFKGDFSGLCFF